MAIKIWSAAAFPSTLTLKMSGVDVVLVRMDKIGDLILSLPVDEHPALGGRRTHWFVTKGLGLLVGQARPARAFTEFKRSFSPGEFFRMVRWLKKEHPRTIVFLHCPWWVTCAAWLAGVPERIGRLSQWHSFLFLNLGVRQKRSAADRHESDYNFDLAEWGFERLGLPRTTNLAEYKKSYLKLEAPPMALPEGLKPKRFVVIHPGMAGSALNWPQDLYRELIERVSNASAVVVTGTKADQKYLQTLSDLKDLKNVHWLVEKLNMSELLSLLSQASVVVAPSTGVIHLAASLGTPVVGLYSPRQVEHPRRWGPKGAKVKVLVPPLAEGEIAEPEVMRLISLNEVRKAMMEVESHPD